MPRRRSTLMQALLPAVFAILLCPSLLPSQSSEPISFKGLREALALTAQTDSECSKPPITFNGLRRSLSIHGVSNSELAHYVRCRGVNFELTPQLESELRAAGADSEILAAVRSSYRGSASNIQPPASQPHASTAGRELTPVQTLFDGKKYDEARSSFDLLSNSAKNSFDGQLLLCKIEQERKQYRVSIQACNAAIQSRPNVAAPYGLNAYSLILLNEIDDAESPASKAALLSDEPFYKATLGFIHYAQEKYDLVVRDIPADTDNSFMLVMLAGATFHKSDYVSFGRYRDKLTSLKGSDNGWALFTDALAAERDLNWDLALDKYKKCVDDSEFIDAICSINLAQVEFLQGNYTAAKSDIDSVLAAHPRNPQAISEGIFISLRVGDTAEADRLHDVMNSIKPAFADSIDCLYYYGRNQPLLATSHCQAAVRDNPNDYGAWDNAGYAALDNADFQSARNYFAKASELFYASKDKHTVTQELDLVWGTITATYFSGDKKRAKDLYRTLRKTYPEYTTTLALKQFPLLWSDTTIKLMDRAVADLQ